MLVVGRRTLFCDPVITETDRGRYEWPKSVAGGAVHQLPCTAGPSSKHTRRNNMTATARYRCVSPGRWTDLDVSRCQYTDHVTRSLADVADVSSSSSFSVSVKPTFIDERHPAQKLFTKLQG